MRRNGLLVLLLSVGFVAVAGTAACAADVYVSGAGAQLGPALRLSGRL